jgi:RimJ/RimL family protein N-acetyltransferase
MNTPRLRQWKESDFEPFAEMNSDPEVMRYFLAPKTRTESLGIFAAIQKEISQRGWGVWAVDVDGMFAGMVGLHVPEWHLPFSPCTEVLWRLRREFWGRGIAHETASQAISYGFSEAGLDEIVSFTTPPNVRSIHLMERLGFERDHQGDFDHPAVPVGHHLRRHVLYRKKKPNKAPEPTPRLVTPRALE